MFRDRNKYCGPIYSKGMITVTWLNNYGRTKIVDGTTITIGKQK